MRGTARTRGGDTQPLSGSVILTHPQLLPSPLPLPQSQPVTDTSPHTSAIFTGKQRHGATSRELLESPHGRVKVPLPGAPWLRGGCGNYPPLRHILLHSNAIRWAQLMGFAGDGAISTTWSQVPGRMLKCTLRQHISLVETQIGTNTSSTN